MLTGVIGGNGESRKLKSESRNRTLTRRLQGTRRRGRRRTARAGKGLQPLWGQELYRSERRKKRRWPGLKPPNTRNKEQEKNRDFKPQMRRNGRRFSGSGHTDDVMRAVILIPLHRQAVLALDGSAALWERAFRRMQQAHWLG